MTWSVYIIALKGGSLYVGCTEDPEERVQEHKKGVRSQYVKSRGVEKLLYVETYGDRGVAFRRERQLKGWSRAKKRALIRGDIEALKKLSSRARKASS